MLLTGESKCSDRYLSYASWLVSHEVTLRRIFINKPSTAVQNRKRKSPKRT